MRKSGYSKAVIGIAGGIGAGKSVIADGLRELGCLVIDSDKVAHEVIQRPAVKSQLVEWWGPGVIKASGEVDRRAVSQRIFGKPAEVARLNGLLHPLVDQERQRVMAGAAEDAAVAAVGLDTPLLFEVGLDEVCDAVIFVKVPYELRLDRVRQGRGWTREELDRRENLQMPLDKKEKLADYVVDNAGEVASSLRQLREIFSQIQAKKKSQED